METALANDAQELLAQLLLYKHISNFSHSYFDLSGSECATIRSLA